mmetsp:Transcript_43305/g.105975  ORF Transcript_43305/g.105975 Transcript_43305/m.105975 type:complete len:223 (+) Transcript_43305:105-773(+)
MSGVPHSGWIAKVSSVGRGRSSATISCAEKRAWVTGIVMLGMGGFGSSKWLLNVSGCPPRNWSVNQYTCDMMFWSCVRGDCPRSCTHIRKYSIVRSLARKAYTPMLAASGLFWCPLYTTSASARRRRTVSSGDRTNHTSISKKKNGVPLSTRARDSSNFAAATPVLRALSASPLSRRHARNGYPPAQASSIVGTSKATMKKALEKPMTLCAISNTSCIMSLA